MLEKLKKGWSPKQISGRLKKNQKNYYVCHETIYRYIDKRGRELYRFLTRKKSFRGKRYGRKFGSGKYLHIKTIHERPKAIMERQFFGHWEGDTIEFATSKYENITTLVERKTRFLMMKKNADRKSEGVMRKIADLIKGCPKKMWKTLTLDQGSEFAQFRQIQRDTKCRTYFCDAHSPWQKGSNENTNGRLQ